MPGPIAGPSKQRNELFLTDSEDGDLPEIGAAEKAPSSPGKPGKGKQRMREPVLDAGEDASMQAADAISDDSEPDSDPDDPVVRSLPVYLTPALASSLALLQYPHRPPGVHHSHPLLPPSLRPDDALEAEDTRTAAERITARYKRDVGHLELSVPLEVQVGKQENRFNDERAKLLGRGQQETDLGENGSGKKSSARSKPSRYEEGSSKTLHRVTLGGESMPDQTWYACAVVKDSEQAHLRSGQPITDHYLTDEVHLTPLTRTIQMRPNLTYLDRIGDLDRRNKRREAGGADGGNSEEENRTASSGDDDEPATTAVQIAERKRKREASDAKKQANGDVKLIHATMKTEEGAGDGGTGGKGGRSGDFKTGRAAASLFGPMKAAEQETWVDLKFHDSTVSNMLLAV